MKIAVEGCCHGELDKIYETLAYIEQQNKMKVDLLLICGDFQAVRNKSDLQCMAVPPKYQKMNTFYKYYNGEKKAPVLTVFIGGNHEASNCLQELPYGGWVAPNIYYLGYAGVINIAGVRIGGLSGIYKAQDYNKGHYEHPPYREDTKRSAYHIRNVDVFRLKQINTPMDVFMSHDWPTGICRYGNVESLLRFKPYFRQEIEAGTLGSPPAEELLYSLKPSYWFSAHLHCKFSALVEHKVEDRSTKHTKFLALDKCLPQKRFLQIMDIPHDSSKPIQLELDPEWLAILKSTNHLMSLKRTAQYMPGPGCNERWDFKASSKELSELQEDFAGVYSVPENFECTGSIYKANEHHQIVVPPVIHVNPQTSLICEMLGIVHPNAVFSGISNEVSLDASAIISSERANTSMNPAEISLEDLEDDEEDDDEAAGEISAGELNYTSFIDDTQTSALESSILSTSTPDKLVLPPAKDSTSTLDVCSKSERESKKGDSLQAKASGCDREKLKKNESVLSESGSVVDSESQGSGDESSQTSVEGVDVIKKKLEWSAFSEEGNKDSGTEMLSDTCSPSEKRPISDAPPTPSPKRMKRRNAQIYSSPAEDL